MLRCPFIQVLKNQYNKNRDLKTFPNLYFYLAKNQTNTQKDNVTSIPISQQIFLCPQAAPLCG